MDAITLLTGEDRIDDASTESFGLLFECAPDSRAWQAGKQTLPLSELIGSFDLVKKQAHCLARRLLAEEPQLAGYGQLGILEEVMIRELQKVLHAIHLFRVLENRGVAVCRVSSLTACVAALRQVTTLQSGGLKVEVNATRVDPASRQASIQRALTRLRQNGLKRDSLLTEWHQVMSRIDPYHRRRWAWFARQKKSLAKGGAWFYSTAYTFSRIGLQYEAFVPGGFRYLVGNPLTGGRALDEADHDYHDLYRFAPAVKAPSQVEIALARQKIKQHIEKLPLSGDDALARRMFLESSFFARFMRVHLPQGLFHARLFERFLDEAEPQAVVVGNPVFEGPLLHLARRRGIPTVLLQHGILGDFCQFIVPPVDHYVVRGTFWQNFLAKDAVSRARILNPPAIDREHQPGGTGAKHILYLTASYESEEFFNPADRNEILLALLQVAESIQRELVIRVHPLENVGMYRQVVAELGRHHALDISYVRYSFGAGLDEVVRDSAVAVTFCSTVFLDCLRYKVPVVSFGWHDFSFREQVEKERVFHFAESLEDLKRLVVEALHGALPCFSGKTQPFLDPTDENQIHDFFSRVVHNKVDKV